MGLIPRSVEKKIDDMLEDDDKHKLKYIMCDISNAILTQNLEIWKHRCKLLYGSRNNNNPPQNKILKYFSQRPLGRKPSKRRQPVPFSLSLSLSLLPPTCTLNNFAPVCSLELKLCGNGEHP